MVENVILFIELSSLHLAFLFFGSSKVGILLILIGVKLFLFFFGIFIELGLMQFSFEINPERISLLEYLSLIEIKF